ncbi:IS30 family, transposase (plasmid) [Streptococcus salivarius M18]|nr:IS30 family, transposase [Streptococcus salivarius M18]
MGTVKNPLGRLNRFVVRYQLEQKPMVAFKTIYNWLYAGLIDLDLSVLRHKGKTRQPKETLGRFRLGTPISQRKQI